MIIVHSARSNSLITLSICNSNSILLLYRVFVWLFVISLVDGDGGGGGYYGNITRLARTKYITSPTSVSSIKIFPQSKPTLGGDYSFLQLYISFNTLTTLLNILENIYYVFIK